MFFLFSFSDSNYTVINLFPVTSVFVSSAYTDALKGNELLTSLIRIFSNAFIWHNESLIPCWLAHREPIFFCGYVAFGRYSFFMNLDLSDWPDVYKGQRVDQSRWGLMIEVSIFLRTRVSFIPFYLGKSVFVSSLNCMSSEEAGTEKNWIAIIFHLVGARLARLGSLHSSDPSFFR